MERRERLDSDRDRPETLELDMDAVSWGSPWGVLGRRKLVTYSEPGLLGESAALLVPVEVRFLCCSAVDLTACMALERLLKN